MKMFCPIIKGFCYNEMCRWFLATGQCAIAVIAMRLDVLIEGVPVVRLFKEEVDER